MVCATHSPHWWGVSSLQVCQLRLFVSDFSEAWILWDQKKGLTSVILNSQKSWEKLEAVLDEIKKKKKKRFVNNICILWHIKRNKNIALCEEQDVFSFSATACCKSMFVFAFKSIVGVAVIISCSFWCLWHALPGEP